MPSQRAQQLIDRDVFVGRQSEIGQLRSVLDGALAGPTLPSPGSSHSLELAMLSHGGRFFFMNAVSAVHREQDIDLTVEAFAQSLQVLRAEDLL
jgi:hypothetical protein